MFYVQFCRQADKQADRH